MTTTFKEAYTVLQNHSKTLREQTDPNIDQLLSIVTESVEAYKTCQVHITAVETALEKALNDTGAAAAASVAKAPAARAARPAPPASSDGTDQS